MTPARLPSVLLVHGNETALIARAEALRGGGFAVIEALSGQHALKLLTVNRPHIVVLDIDLPDMSGIDVSHEIKTDPRLNSVKVVLCSADFNSPRDQLHGLEAGKADVYLNAPVKSAELISVVRRLLPPTSPRPPGLARRPR